MSFYYYDSPQITKVLPVQGPIEGGNEVALLGTGFMPLKGITEVDDMAQCDF